MSVEIIKTRETRIINKIDKYYPVIGAGDESEFPLGFANGMLYIADGLFGYTIILSKRISPDSIIPVGVPLFCINNMRNDVLRVIRHMPSLENYIESCAANASKYLDLQAVMREIPDGENGNLSNANLQNIEAIIPQVKYFPGAQKILISQERGISIYDIKTTTSYILPIPTNYNIKFVGESRGLIAFGENNDDAGATPKVLIYAGGGSCSNISGLFVGAFELPKITTGSETSTNNKITRMVVLIAHPAGTFTRVSNSVAQNIVDGAPTAIKNNTPPPDNSGIYDYAMYMMNGTRVWGLSSATLCFHHLDEVGLRLTFICCDVLPNYSPTGSTYGTMQHYLIKFKVAPLYCAGPTNMSLLANMPAHRNKMAKLTDDQLSASVDCVLAKQDNGENTYWKNNNVPFINFHVGDITDI